MLNCCRSCAKVFHNFRFQLHISSKIQMTLNPRDSGDFIVKNAKYLQVHDAKIDDLKNVILDGLISKKISIENFSQHDVHPKLTEKYAIDWIFLVDTLNFCFWTSGNNTKWRVDNHTGYFALCAAINRAIKNGKDITNPKFYTTLNYDDLAEILKSDDGVTEVPLINERVMCLHEVGKKLLEKYNGSFETCVKLCNGSAEKLLNLIVNEFPCFRDEAEYLNKRVSLYKRAQILIGDIWSCYRGKDLGHFYDIQTVTMFADYRVPQVLIHFGTLEYKPELMEFLQRNEIMQNGDEREVEIRGASIYIVEELKKKIRDEIEAKELKIPIENVNSILLDHFLWDYRRKFASQLEHIPFHKVLSIYY